jgi:Spy/CpxP family protein refolding chaperone
MKKFSCKSNSAFRNLMIGALVTVSVPLIISACRTKEMSPPERATEFVTAHLDLSDEQTRKVAPLAQNMFAEKEELLEMRKTLNIEIIAQMKSDTADAAKLEAVLNKNIEQLSLKLAKFSTNFAEFHAILTPEQRTELVEKIESRLDHADERERRGHWGRRWF